MGGGGGAGGAGGKAAPPGPKSAPPWPAIFAAREGTSGGFCPRNHSCVSGGGPSAAKLIVVQANPKNRGAANSRGFNQVIADLRNNRHLRETMVGPRIETVPPKSAIVMPLTPLLQPYSIGRNGHKDTKYYRTPTDLYQLILGAQMPEDCVINFGGGKIRAGEQLFVRSGKNRPIFGAYRRVAM